MMKPQDSGCNTFLYISFIRFTVVKDRVTLMTEQWTQCALETSTDIKVSKQRSPGSSVD